MLCSAMRDQRNSAIDLATARQLNQRNVHLEDLNVSHNKIAHSSVFEIGSMLQENRTLTKLALSGNRLTEESIKVLPALSLSLSLVTHNAPCYFVVLVNRYSLSPLRPTRPCSISKSTT